MNELETYESFELWDLRVEAVVPPGAKVYCGARAGDYFELKGEMLTLPPGQGLSIYSLAAVLPLLAANSGRTAASEKIETLCPGGRVNISPLSSK